jgi:Family of unknown function (DUF5985)
MPLLLAFLNGGTAMGSLIIGVLFLAYWRDSRDRLFVYFAVAFWILALNWILVAVFAPTAEQRHWFYVFRLLGFLLIIVGIADKNRRP